MLLAARGICIVCECQEVERRARLRARRRKMHGYVCAKLDLLAEHVAVVVVVVVLLVLFV